ncbi:MAG: hydroxypyruvate isomerase [Planctomycetes bacterium]|nr:hydroxypyruvate isomerase [Planctomycetota bacterium]
MDRRDFLRFSGTTLALASTPLLRSTANGQESKTAAPPQAAPTPRKNRIKHSVARWCFGGMTLDDLARHSAAIGLGSVEILGPGDWPVVKQYGIGCAVAIGIGSISDAWNRADLHDELVKQSETLIPQCAAAGVPNIVIFSGNKRGQPDAEGIANCITGLRRVAKTAEQHGITLVMEILNSKVDHGDYAFDRMKYGLDIVQGVGSDRMKILYDIYHAQIMEGDVIHTIKDHHASIGHYHTAGVPGRNELDENQELHYPAICRAIVETGFKGWLGQEFIPKRDAMTSLREAIDTCDV